MEFGYHPPSGYRGFEDIRQREYLSDMHNALDIASQSFNSLWVSDHLSYSDEFRLECWTHLTWIASRYPGPKLGTIVMSNSFRHPSLMAKMAATVQMLSSGRLILGYGAGYYEKEYKAYGFDYPQTRVRIEMLEEALQVMKMLWTESPAIFKGKHYFLEGAFSEPRPQPLPVIMIGGTGEKYAMKVIARHADWWNDLLRPTDQLAHKLKVLKMHCGNEGRDFNSIRKTLSVRLILDRSHRKALDLAGDTVNTGYPPIVGDPSSVIEQLQEYAELGFDMSIISLKDFQGLKDMKLFVDKVMPYFN